MSTRRLINRFIPLLCIFIFNAPICDSNEYNCTWNHGNATFDLCAWQLDRESQGSGSWEVYDERDSYSNNFTYHFNVCADVVSTDTLNDLCTDQVLRQQNHLPLGYCSNIIDGKCQCINSTANSEDSTNCDNINDQSIEPIYSNTAAYQMPRSKSDDGCYRLHDGQTPPEFALMDPLDPTVGVTLKYTNGDWCAVFGV